MHNFKYHIFNIEGEWLCRPGIDSLKDAVDMAKSICFESFKRRGKELTLYVERVNGECDFERILRVFHDGNSVKVVKMSQKV